MIGSRAERPAHVSDRVARPAPDSRGRHERPKPARPRAEKPKETATPKPVPMPSSNDATNNGYKLPPLSLLDEGTGGEINKRALEDTARQLEETLIQHGVDAHLTKIVPGPTVTRYEIELAPGVKVNRVSSLAHDIAYALATPDVRLLVPDPGQVGHRGRGPQHASAGW